MIGRPRIVHYKIMDTGWESPCWIWQASLNGGGYGPHREFYLEHVGPIPDGMELDHLCRQRSCVNPEHLEVVTNTENMRRGRATKLPMETVEEIRASPGTFASPARKYGVDPSTISMIKSGKSRRSPGYVQPSPGPCPHCGRIFKSNVSLGTHLSHMERGHKTTG